MTHVTNQLSSSAFLERLSWFAPRGTRVWVTHFKGDPGKDGKWHGHTYQANSTPVDTWTEDNTYFCVSALRADDDGQWSRRKDNFVQLLALVADDVVSMDSEPSWSFATSPGKRQVGILLNSDDKDTMDMRLCDAVIRRIAGDATIGADKSGNNVVRWVRLPVGQNQKPREEGHYDVNVEHWNPDRRVTLREACKAFKIDLQEVKDQIREGVTGQGMSAGLVEGPQDEKLTKYTELILSGDALHQTTTEMAASLVASGMNGGATTNLLRSLMHASRAPKDERWESRYMDIPRAVRTAEEKYKPAQRSPVLADIDEDTGEVKPRKPLFEHAGQMLDDLTGVNWLVEGYLETDALSMCFGPSGVGKSFVMIDIACCIATGLDWHCKPVLQGPVFYVAGEGHNGFRRRVAAWNAHNADALQTAGLETMHTAPLFKSRKAVMMMDGDAVQEVIDEIKAYVEQTGNAPVAVIIDTLARNMGDGDENVAKDANKFIEGIDSIRREWNCNVIVVHHSGHTEGRARGSTAFKGAMDQEIEISGGNGTLKVSVTKMKDAEEPEERMFSLKDVKLGWDRTKDPEVEISSAVLSMKGNRQDIVIGKTRQGKPVTAGQMVDACRDGWPGIKVLADKTKFDTHNEGINSMLKRCMSLGLLVKDGKGYALGPAADEGAGGSIDATLHARNKQLESDRERSEY